VAHLEAIENDFQKFLLRGEADIEKSVIGTARVPLATRLAIYGDAYRLRLVETLQSHYPALLALLGEEEFSALGAAYVRAHDSTFASIRYYGARLAELLATDPQYASRRWLAELARFEWAMTEVFDAADTVSISAQALSAVAPQEWAQLGFELDPSVRCLELTSNAPALWRALTDGKEPPAPEAQPHARAWLLWRRDLQIYFRPLTALEAEALSRVRAGGSFGELCDALASALDAAEAAPRAAAFLREWVESGLIVGIHACKE
jgi:hypothetical protein